MNPTRDTALFLGRMLSFGLPLVLFVLTSSPEPYWLDSPELTAAAQTLGLAHPPGHPIYVLLTKPFTLLPLGGIAFRVALASAFFGALSALLIFDITWALIQVMAPRLDRWIQVLTASCAALAAVFAPGYWFQSVRAEVYALQICLVLAAVRPLISYCIDPAPRRSYLLLLSAFIFGLSAANHHFVAAGAAVAAIPVFVSETRRRGGRGAVMLSLKAVFAGLLGLVPYAFIPLRSAGFPGISLGGAHSVRDFFWVVSARVYQKSMVREHVSSVSERAVDSVFTMIGDLGPIIAVLAVAGIYVSLRIRRSRLAGASLALLAGVPIVLRAIMGFDPFNPDYYGYMLPVMAAAAVFFGVFAAVAMDVLRVGVPKGRVAVPFLALALAAVPLARAKQSYPVVDLSELTATREVLDASLMNTSPGSLVLASYYKLFFVLWSAKYIDGYRPDVVVVNPQLFGYPGYLVAQVQRHPMLKVLARAMLVEGRLTEDAVAKLAWEGRLFIEPDPEMDSSVVRYLSPQGPVYEAMPEPLSEADVLAAADEALKQWANLYEMMGTDFQELETKRFLFWRHYEDAIFFARRGATQAAKRSIEMARSLEYRAAVLEALDDALTRKPNEPIDISPFLPSAAGKRSPGR